MNADSEAGPLIGAVRTPKLVPRMLTTDQILGNVETAVIVVDHDGCLRYANSFAADLFGFPGPRHLTDVPFRRLGFHEEDVSKVENLEYQACRGRDWEGTLAIRRPDGSNFFVRMTAAPMRGPAGEVAGTVIMARQAVQVGTEKSTGRTGLLDRIGERLGSSLELDETLQRVADTLVPQFADHCFIDLRLKEVLVRRVQKNAWGWKPPKGGDWPQVGDTVVYPPDHYCSKAMAQNETVLIEDVTDKDHSPSAAANLEDSRNAGVTSVIAAPLVMRGQELGVMTLALSDLLTDRDTRHYVADDRDLVAAIASRVSVAIDNALLFEEERATALAFQNSLLPSKPPVLDGLEVAYRYVPAKPLESHGQGIQTQVGGDWYDIIPLSAGRVGIVIGDVEGRGARAAAIMGQLRSALRAFAQDDKPPAEILRRLDDWCRTLGPSQVTARGLPAADPPIVSCTYLVYDAWSRSLSFANAGHEVPLLVTGLNVSQMEIEHKGVLLGVRGPGIAGVPTYREETRLLAPGSTLVFYTDGLTDRRQRADGTGHYTETEALQMLRQAVQSVALGSVEDIAQAAEQAVPGDIDDDMAIVVVRTSATDLASWEGNFPAEPIRVSEARRLAGDTFARWGMELEQVDLACLLVSEVVTNVVLHAAISPSPRNEFVAGASGSAQDLAAGPAWSTAASQARGVVPDLAEEDELFADWPDRPFIPGHAGAAGKEFTLRLRRGTASIWVEVFDADLRLPRIRSAGETDEGGRGLYLVDQLAARWGSRPTHDGKAVWFEVPLSGGIAGC